MFQFYVFSFFHMPSLIFASWQGTKKPPLLFSKPSLEQNLQQNERELAMDRLERK
jgi:hypothetical protein